MKKILITLLLLGMLGAGGYYAWTEIRREQEAARPEQERTIKVERRTIEETVEANGIVEPIISTDVRSEISGKIADILVEDGAIVKAGQRLIELDRTSLETDYREAQRNFQGQKLRVQQARRDYERLQELYERNFAREKELLDAETDLELAEIELEVRQARLDKATENLSKTTILAPHAGIVANLDINEGQVIIGATSVNQGTRLMTVYDSEGLYVQTDINELDIAKIEVGDEARVTFDALPDQEFNGSISQIHSYARNEGNRRVFRVRITFESGERTINPGISANLVIPIDKVEEAPSLLISAVYTENGKKFVYRVNGEKEDGTLDLEKVSVETGLNNAQYVEIRSGVDVGTTISLTRPAGARES